MSSLKEKNTKKLVGRYYTYMPRWLYLELFLVGGGLLNIFYDIFNTLYNYLVFSNLEEKPENQYTVQTQNLGGVQTPQAPRKLLLSI